VSRNAHREARQTTVLSEKLNSIRESESAHVEFSMYPRGDMDRSPQREGQPDRSVLAPVSLCSRKYALSTRARPAIGGKSRELGGTRLDGGEGQGCPPARPPQLGACVSSCFPTLLGPPDARRSR